MSCRGFTATPRGKQLLITFCQGVPSQNAVKHSFKCLGGFDFQKNIFLVLFIICVAAVVLGLNLTHAKQAFSEWPHSPQPSSWFTCVSFIPRKYTQKESNKQKLHIYKSSVSGGDSLTHKRYLIINVKERELGLLQYQYLYSVKMDKNILA